MEKNTKISMEKISYPTSKKVVEQFGTTLVGIILLIIFFILADSLISILLEQIYQTS